MDQLTQSLRKLVYEYAKRTFEEWQPSWTIDADDTYVTEDGPPARTAQEFLGIMSRPKRWACAYVLKWIAKATKYDVLLLEGGSPCGV